MWAYIFRGTTNSKLQELSYRDACLTRGLLEDDEHLSLAMEPAIIVQAPLSLRNLLTIIILFCEPKNPYVWWEKFCDQFSEDFLRQHRRNIRNPQAEYAADVYNRAL